MRFLVDDPDLAKAYLVDAPSAVEATRAANRVDPLGEPAAADVTYEIWTTQVEAPEGTGALGAAFAYWVEAHVPLPSGPCTELRIAPPG